MSERKRFEAWCRTTNSMPCEHKWIGWQAALSAPPDTENRRAQPAAPADAAPSVAPEPVAWEGGEGWESLAWELCADENGEDACNELIWEGGPIPEPWGDRWMKYEGEAKRLIALVHKHAAHPPRAPLTEELEILKSDLISCRGPVKTELHHYERLSLVHGKTPLAANYEAEASRLQALLDRIEALESAQRIGEKT